jgi:hypothetical protein
MAQTAGLVMVLGVSLVVGAVQFPGPVEGDLKALVQLAKQHQRARTGTGFLQQLVSKATGPRMVEPGRALALLRDTYGIRVAGSFTTQDLVHVLLFARLQQPRATRGLTFEFAAKRITKGGNLGEWAEDGLATINSDRADTVFHEGMHHVLEFEKNDHGRMMGILIHDAALAAGDGKLPDSCVTRSYARSHRFVGDYGEFEAELATAIAAQEVGFPLETRVENPRFNPPARVRELVRKLWVLN